MKRFIIMLSLVIFSLSLFSCAGNNETHDNGNGEDTTENDVLSDYEINIGQVGADDSYLFAYSKGTTLGDALTEHIDTVSKANSCTFNILNLTSEKVLNDLAVGISSCNLLFTYDSGVFTDFAKAGAFVSLNDYSDVLKFETDDVKWGSVYIRELGMFKGVQYGLVPYSWPEMSPGIAGALAVNEQLVKNFNKNDPRELVENKKWSWTDFESYLRECTFEDGIQYYGFCTAYFYDLVMTAFVSNGCEVFRFAEDGTYTSDVNSPQGLEALQWASDLSVNYIDCIYNKTLNLNATGAGNAFRENNVFVLMTSTSEYTQQLSYEMEDIAFLPFPVGPNGEYGKWGGFSYDSFQLEIFDNSDDHDVMAHAVNVLCEPIEAYSGKDALLNYYTENVFYDSRDAEFYLELSNSARYTIFYSAVGFAPFWNGFLGTSKTAAAVVDSTFDKYLPIAEEYILPNAEYINSMLK